MQHVNFPYAFADNRYIMGMNDYGDKIHGAKKNEFEKKVNATKQTSKNSKSPRTVQNQLNFLHEKKLWINLKFPT